MCVGAVLILCGIFRVGKSGKGDIWVDLKFMKKLVT